MMKRYNHAFPFFLYLTFFNRYDFMQEKHYYFKQKNQR
jgi:hypothetical protein